MCTYLGRPYDIENSPTSDKSNFWLSAIFCTNKISQNLNFIIDVLKTSRHHILYRRKCISHGFGLIFYVCERNDSHFCIIRFAGVHLFTTFKSPSPIGPSPHRSVSKRRRSVKHPASFQTLQDYICIASSCCAQMRCLLKCDATFLER